VDVPTAHSLKISLRLGLATLIVCLAWVAAAPAAASAIEVGVFNPGGPSNGQSAEAYDREVGRRPDIVLWYHDFGDSLLTPEEMSALRSTGETPLVTWEPYNQSLASIAAGGYDSYIRDSARIAKSWGGELMVRFAHEMNGAWYPWARSESYVAAWRHIVEVFREEGATNVRWVWAPNVNRSGSMPFSAYFPGDEYVDYVGLDGYNFGATEGNRWYSFRELFSSSYAAVTQLSSKPVIVTETSSSETGGDKAAWIRSAYLQTIPTEFPRIKAVVWFNKVQEDNWPIDSSQASLEAYREVVNCTIYGGPNPCAAGEASAAAAEGEAGEAVALEAVHVTPRVVAATTAQPSGTVAYRLNHKAKVRIKVEQRRRGSRRRRHRLRGRHRYVRRIVIARSGHRGRNRLPLRRLLRHRRVGKGSYRVIVVAIDRAGRRTHPRRVHFRVLR